MHCCLVCFSFFHWVKFCSGCYRHSFSFGRQKSGHWLHYTGGHLIHLYGNLFGWTQHWSSETSGCLIEVVVWTGLTVLYFGLYWGLNVVLGPLKNVIFVWKILFRCEIHEVIIPSKEVSGYSLTAILYNRV